MRHRLSPQLPLKTPVRKPRRYCFESAWTINAPVSKVWQVLTATPFSWPKWWPELKDVKNMRITPDLQGTSFSCAWQAPIGYRLKTDIIISQVNYLKDVTLKTDGDLVGSVTCHIREIAGSTYVDINWEVDTTKSWMNHFYVILRPFFIASHHAVMRSGERGLQKYLTKTSA